MGIISVLVITVQPLFHSVLHVSGYLTHANLRSNQFFFFFYHHKTLEHEHVHITSRKENPEMDPKSIRASMKANQDATWKFISLCRNLPACAVSQGFD